MALNSRYAQWLNNALGGIGGDTFDPESIKVYLQNIKAQGVSDEDLKPYLDKFTQAGYNIGPDFSLTKTTGGTNAPGTYTPATPTQPAQVIPTQPAPSEVPGKTIPGPTIDLNSDRGQIEQEAAREKQQTLGSVQQAQDLRTQGLGSLADILQKQNQAQFNYDLPGIKEDLGASGLFTSPSALSAAVARESGMLGANTAATLGQAGIQNINLGAEGLLGATAAQTGMESGGLQRQFSLADYQKQADLARQIGSSMLPQSPGFSLTGALGGGSAAGIAGSGLLATNPGLYATLIGGSALAGGARGSSGAGTYICTAMKELGILTQEEVDRIHDHLFPIFSKRIPDVIAYGVCGPILVVEALRKGIDLGRWKEFFFRKVIQEEDSEKAFNLYADAFKSMWQEVF